MELSNGQVYSLKGAIPQLLELDVPAKVGIQVARLVKRLSTEIGLIDEAKDKLIAKYGEVNDAGVPQLYGPGNPDHPGGSPGWAEFMAELNDLLAGTVDVAVEKVQLPANTKIGVSALLAFDGFVGVDEG